MVRIVIGLVILAAGIFRVDCIPCPTYENLKATLDQAVVTVHNLLATTEVKLNEKLEYIRATEEANIHNLDTANKTIEWKWQELSKLYQWLFAQSLDVYALLDETFSGANDVYGLIENSISPLYTTLDLCGVNNHSYYLLIDQYDFLYVDADIKNDELYPHAGVEIDKVLQMLERKSTEFDALSREESNH